MAVAMTGAVVVVVGCYISAKDCLADKMVLTKIVLAVGWMRVKEAAKGDGLVAVNWVQWMVN